MPICSNCGEEAGNTRYCGNCGRLSENYSEPIKKTKEPTFCKNPDCGVLIPAGRETCPGCLRKVYGDSSPSWGGIIAVFIVIVIAVGLYVGLNTPEEPVAPATSRSTTSQTNTYQQSNTSNQEKKPTKADEIAKLQPTDVSSTVNSYILKITGKLKNTTSYDLSYVAIYYELYDASGNKLDTTFTNVTNLRKGETWKFEISSFEEKTRNIRFYKIEAW